MSEVLDARTSLEFDPRGIHLVEASAGTGKTYTIANLYLRHVLDGRLPAEILVVTYTNAATAELKERIHARLYRALHCLRSGQADDDEFLRQLLQRQQDLEGSERELRQHRLAYALRGMDEAAISTIHGFCQAALIDHAFLGNREFDAEVIGTDETLWDQALKDWWRLASYELDTEAWQRLADATGADVAAKDEAGRTPIADFQCPPFAVSQVVGHVGGGGWVLQRHSRVQRHAAVAFGDDKTVAGLPNAGYRSDDVVGADPAVGAHAPEAWRRGGERAKLAGMDSHHRVAVAIEAHRRNDWEVGGSSRSIRGFELLE